MNCNMLCLTDVSKAFKSYDNQYLRLIELLTGGKLQTHTKKYVLQDVNLVITQGESIGLIGRNGAGKSTLLKLIADTLKPSSGQIERHGKIFAILELGMGFDFQLTGRDNAILSLHMMGAITDVEQKVEKIKIFSELNEFFEQPIRIYSSGMLVRLAFSIATVSEPDVLIIDEALSVGDAYFQQKCLLFIESFRQSGGTLLFVSHDPNAVKTICNRALLVDRGRVLLDDDPKEVLDFYQSNILAMADNSEQEVKTTFKSEIANTPASSVTQNGSAELLDFSLCDVDGNQVKYIESESLICVNYKIKFLKLFERPAFGIIVRDKYGRSIFETTTFGQRYEVPSLDCEIVAVSFEFSVNLAPGDYSFSIGVANKGFAESEFEEYALLIHDIAFLKIIRAGHNKFYGGIFNMSPRISVNRENGMQNER